MIETEMLVRATRPEVWQVVGNPARWADWHDPAARSGLRLVEVLEGEQRRVGDRHRCTTTSRSWPLLGRRNLTWDQQITDITPGRTLEVEALGRAGHLSGWRLRLWLLDDSKGQTRVRCRLVYPPAALSDRLGNALFLRRRLAKATERWLHDLAHFFETSDEAAGSSATERPAASQTGRGAEPMAA